MKVRHQRLARYVEEAVSDGSLPETFKMNQLIALIYKDVEMACDKIL